MCTARCEAFFLSPDAPASAHSLSPPPAQSKSLDVQEYDDGAEFDGGDSGSGAVGDGNVDLEDQHNSATLGGNRGGFTDIGSASSQVGRGNVQTLVDDYDGLNEQDEFGGVRGGAESGTARTKSAGANYFGRSTGLADTIIQDMNSGKYDEMIKNGRIDKVRAQQKENWFNQRAIHEQNRAQGQGVVFGEDQTLKPRSGGYIARESIASDAWRKGAKESEISQSDLADHLQDLASAPAARLDGEAWGVLDASDTEVTQTFEMRASPRQTDVVEIPVQNDLNTFAPFQCNFVGGSSDAFSVSPNEGTMNRRSGDPIPVVVRYTPRETGNLAEATLVFETEDMKKVYKFIGST